MNRKALEEAFALFDKDGDGCITSEELFTVLKGLGQEVTDEEATKMIQKVDKDGNGLVDLNEFIQMMGTKLDHPLKKDSEVRSLFNAFDKDNSGYIDKSELKNTMKDVGFDLSNREVETMMKAAGVVDKDKIFYEDFVKMMSGMTPQKKSLHMSGESMLIYSPEEKKIQDLRIAFSMFDKDGDGKISCEEVFQTLNSIGMKVDRKSAKKMVRQVDLDGNGSICFEEFQQLMRNRYGSTVSLADGGLDLKEMFTIFDKDHDGYLSVPDLKDTMKQLGICLTDADVFDMMRTVNVERHGRISYHDFEKLFYLNGARLSRMSSMASLNNVIKSKVQDKEGLQAVFSLFDKDGDGFITMDEVEKVLMTMQVSTSKEYIREIFEQVDMDGNGRIDFEEFVQLTTRYKNSQSDEQEIEEMFNLIDKDRSGSIEINELKETFVAIGVPIGDEDVAEMMREAKVEGDTIYYEDFVRIMKMLQLCPPSSAYKELKVPQKPERSISHKSVQRKISSNQEPVERKSSNHRPQRTSTSSQSSTTSNPWVPPTTSRRRRSSSTTWEAFKVFDHNCDGYISKKELFDTMKQLGIKLSIEDLNEMMKQADINGDGKIDYSEFVKLMTGTFESYAEQAALLHRQLSQKSSTTRKFNDLPGDEEMRASFKVFDINGDGFIDPSELRQTLKSFGNKITDEEVGNMLRSADTNNDGRIDYEEFIQILHAK